MKGMKRDYCLVSGGIVLDKLEVGMILLKLRISMRNFYNSEDPQTCYDWPMTINWSCYIRDDKTFSSWSLNGIDIHTGMFWKNDLNSLLPIYNKLSDIASAMDFDNPMNVFHSLVGKRERQTNGRVKTVIPGMKCIAVIEDWRTYKCVPEHRFPDPSWSLYRASLGDLDEKHKSVSVMAADEDDAFRKIVDIMSDKSCAAHLEAWTKSGMGVEKWNRGYIKYGTDKTWWMPFETLVAYPQSIAQPAAEPAS